MISELDTEYPRLSREGKLARLRQIRAGYPAGHDEIKWIAAQLERVEKGGE